MNIIKDQSQLGICVGGAVNLSVQWGHISYTQDAAILEHVQPLIGGDMVTALVDTLAISTDATSWIYWMQRATSRLMLHEYAKAAVELTPNGFMRTQTENKASAFKYQEEAYRSMMLRSAYNFMEEGMKRAEEAQLPLWIDSPARRNATRYVPWATDMSMLTGKTVSRYDYERLVPVMDDIQEMVISRIIPPTSSCMIGSYLSAGLLTGKCKKLFTLIQKAVANLSISEAIEKRWVTLYNGEVLTTTYSGDDNVFQSQVAGEIGVMAKIRSHNAWGSVYILKVIDYIRSEPVEFADILDFYNQNFPGTVASTSDDVCCPDRTTLICPSPRNGIVSL